MIYNTRAIRAGGRPDRDSSGVFTSELLKNLSTAIPIAHLLASCFFIFGYCQGFGHHIIAFITLSDVFAASIRAMGQAYLFCLLPVVAAWAFKSWRRKRMLGVAFGAGFLIILSAQAFTVLLPQLSSERSHRSLGEYLSILAMISIFAAFLSLLIIAELRSKLTVNYLSRNIMIGFSAVLLFSLALGVNKGAIDEGRDHARTVGHYSSCGPSRNVVIRPVGPYFLALSSTDAWLLVDGECHGRFELRPSPRPARAAAGRPRNP